MACEAPRADGSPCTRVARHQVGERRLCGVHRRCCPDEDVECPICLSRIDTKKTMATMGCGHSFHTSCLRAWFRDRPLTCPMCRAVCLEGMAIVGRRVAPKLHALLRTVPCPPRTFFPAYIVSHLQSPRVIESLGNDKNLVELLMDIACECFTKDNFFTKIRNMRL